MICFECGKEIAEGKKFCKYCGARLEFKCPECGHSVDEDSLFCDECGAKLDFSSKQKSEKAPAPKAKKAEKKAADEFSVPANAVVIPKNIAESDNDQLINNFFSLHAKAKVFTFAEDVRCIREDFFRYVETASPEDIYIPSNVKSIESYALDGSSIKHIHFAEGVRGLHRWAVTSDAKSLKTIDIYETSYGIAPYERISSTSEYVPDDIYNLKNVYVNVKPRTDFEPPEDALVIPRALLEYDGYEASQFVEDHPECSDFIIEPGTEKIFQYAFYSNKRYTPYILYLPDSVKEIDGNQYFNSCGKLAGINLPDSIISMGVLLGKKIGSKLVLPPKLEKMTSDYSSNLYYKDINEIVFSDTLTELSIPYLFSGIHAEKIKIPSSITKIGPNIFSDCTFLKSIELPDSITEIPDGAFGGCSYLKNITIPNSVTSIGDGAFEGCTSLKNITIPDSVTKIGGSAFKGTSIEYLEIPYAAKAFFELTLSHNGPVPNKQWGFVFKNCAHLKAIKLPELGKDQAYHEYGFDGCDSLETIILPSGTTGVPDEIEIKTSSGGTRKVKIIFE